jgi:hypothetical protein
MTAGTPSDAHCSSATCPRLLGNLTALAAELGGQAGI